MAKARRWPKAIEGPGDLTVVTEDENLLAEQIRAQQFDDSITAYSEFFKEQLAEAKPILDYVTMLSIHAGLIGAFGWAMHTMAATGYSDRLAGGAFIIATIWFQLLPRMSRANDACVRVVLLKAVRRLGLPHPDTLRSASLSVLWLAALATGESFVMLGSGAAGYALVQAATEQGRSSAQETTTKPEKVPKKGKGEARHN